MRYDCVRGEYAPFFGHSRPPRRLHRHLRRPPRVLHSLPDVLDAHPDDRSPADTVTRADRTRNCNCVCFCVLCNRHWFNRVPGPVTNLGCLSTLHPCSDAGYADLPLTLLGAQSTSGPTRATVSQLSPRPRLVGRPPGTIWQIIVCVSLFYVIDTGS
jgi:hypothetical protein